MLLGAVASLPALLGLNVRVTSLAHGFSEFSLPGCFQQTLTERLMPRLSARFCANGAEACLPPGPTKGETGCERNCRHRAGWSGTDMSS